MCYKKIFSRKKKFFFDKKKFLAKTVFDEKNNVHQLAKKKCDKKNKIDLITKNVINK